MPDTFTKAVKSDKRFKTLNKMLRSGAYKLDSEALLQEISIMHQSRSTRKFKYSDVVKTNQKRVINALVQTQKYRSRCAEIKNQCNKIQFSLANHVDRLSKYYKIKYWQQLKSSGFTTVNSQNAAIQSVMNKAYTQIEEIKMIEKAASILIEDLDKASFMLYQTVETLKVTTRPERNI